MSAIYDSHMKKVDIEQLCNLGEDRKSVSWREDTGMRNMSQRGWAPRLPVEQPGERERNAVMAIRMGINILQFCSDSNSPLT